MAAHKASSCLSLHVKQQETWDISDTFLAESKVALFTYFRWFYCLATFLIFFTVHMQSFSINQYSFSFVFMCFCYCHITCYTPFPLLSSFLVKGVHFYSEENHGGCWLHGASAWQQQTNVWLCAWMSKTPIISRLHVRCSCTASCTCFIYIEGLRTVSEGHLLDGCDTTCVLV